MECSGYISIPLFLTKNPRNFLDSITKAHLSGFNRRWCNLMSEKPHAGGQDGLHGIVI